MRPFTRPAKAGILAAAVILVGHAALAGDARRFETDFGDPIGNLRTDPELSSSNSGDSVHVEQSQFKWAELSESTEGSSLRGN
jgi:hypothetical protein